MTNNSLNQNSSQSIARRRGRALALAALGLARPQNTTMRAAPIVLLAVALLAIFIISAARRSAQIPAAQRTLSQHQPEAASQQLPAGAAIPTAAAPVPRPPAISAEKAWLHGPPTPVAKLRGAAKVYFPAMFDGSHSSLPETFEAGQNPCWSGKHCLPAFLLLGVYQSGVRDFYSRLSKHPGVAQRPANSPSYYSQVHPTWPEYVKSLDNFAAPALAGQLLGEASAVTFHFVWVHQEKASCHSFLPSNSSLFSVQT